MSGKGKEGDPREVAVDPARSRRRRHEWPLALVLLGVLAGLLLTAADRFRIGSAVLSATMLLALVLRAVLPERQAGLLVVRSRPLDLLVLGVLAVGMAVLTVVVPPPTGSDRLSPGEGASQRLNGGVVGLSVPSDSLPRSAGVAAYPRQSAPHATERSTTTQEAGSWRAQAR